MSQAGSSDSSEVIEVDLRNQKVAALLAWLWPGAGHIYQRRYGKGALFMTCILGTFFFGLVLGGGHVVYASSWNDVGPGARPGFKGLFSRWHFGCQACVGAPVLPALVQRIRVSSGREPLFNKFMAPPNDPTPYSPQNGDDDLAVWNKQMGNAFELGTLYTIIAGLLNVLAIYDAYAGPFTAVPEEEQKKNGNGKKRKTQPENT